MKNGIKHITDVMLAAVLQKLIPILYSPSVAFKVSIFSLCIPDIPAKFFKEPRNRPSKCEPEK